MMRPALKYYGGKWLLAPWIISHFPQHAHYLEPCFGAGSVLLRKPPAFLETANDLNGDVINYFRQLRERPEDLIRLIDATPWAEGERNYLLDNIPNDDLDRARRFYVLCAMSISGGPVFDRSSWRYSKCASNGVNPVIQFIDHGLSSVAERLRMVQFASRDALEIIEDHIDIPNLLIYFDPPYLLETRNGSGKRYGRLDSSVKLHTGAADLLTRASGFVVISGYRSKLYEDLYESCGFTRVDKRANSSGGAKIESIWICPRVSGYLYERQGQLNLFRTTAQGEL